MKTRWQILRFPICVKKAIEKMKVFLSKKKRFLFIMFSSFSNVKILIFSQKNFIERAEKAFLRIHTIWYTFYSKFATLKRFWKISSFSKKLIYFFKKNPKFQTLRNPTVSVALYGKFATIWFKKFIFTNVNEHRECNWQTCGKKLFLLRGNLCSFHFISNLARNNYLPVNSAKIFQAIESR